MTLLQAAGAQGAAGGQWTMWVMLLLIFVVFAVPSRYVSLGSVCAAASLPVWCLVWGFPLVSVLPILVVSLIVIWAHRGNIRKLAAGEERKFAFHKGGDPTGEKGKRR